MKPALAALLVLAAAQAGAQSIKPGLWEITNKVNSANPATNQALGLAMQQLANMPPAQRQQMEEMMAQHGASLPKPAGNGGMVVTACITPEMAARHELPLGQQGNCSSHTQQVPSGMDVTFSCSNPASSGKGQLRFQGDTAYVMHMNMTTSAGGAPEQMAVDTSGRWLGATCPPGGH